MVPYVANTWIFAVSLRENNSARHQPFFPLWYVIRVERFPDCYIPLPIQRQPLHLVKRQLQAVDCKEPGEKMASVLHHDLPRYADWFPDLHMDQH